MDSNKTIEIGIISILLGPDTNFQPREIESGIIVLVINLVPYLCEMK